MYFKNYITISTILCLNIKFHTFWCMKRGQRHLICFTALYLHVFCHEKFKLFLWFYNGAINKLTLIFLKSLYMSVYNSNILKLAQKLYLFNFLCIHNSSFLGCHFGLSVWGFLFTPKFSIWVVLTWSY